MNGEQFYEMIDSKVLGILQKHLDTWRNKQISSTFKEHPSFQDIDKFIIYWYRNRKVVENLKSVPGFCQGNMAYILKVINHYYVISESN